MSVVVAVLGQGLLLLGSLLVGAAAVGMVRLPDVYARTNAVAKAAGLGLVLVLLGGMVLAPTAGAVVTLLVAVGLQLFTVPIAGFEIGQAARLTGAVASERTHVDEIDLPTGDDDAHPRSG
ncbi:cation:proton antiporter [Pseudokineococcus sp. 1T1Z-3]|uniref:cation:proton antiporter n=1 Tax=Pseudokineococcus sp. 1T1Z-3 TaxID=3132745 RepID=UPI0030B5BA28